MNAEQKLEMIREALVDCDGGKITELTTLTIVRMVVNTVQPDEKSLAWARKVVSEHPEWDSLPQRL